MASRSDLSLDNNAITNTVSAQAEQLLDNNAHQAATLAAVHDTNMTMLTKLDSVQSLVFAQQIEQAIVPAQLAAFMATIEARTAFLDSDNTASIDHGQLRPSTSHQSVKALPQQVLWQSATGRVDFDTGRTNQNCTCCAHTTSTTQQMRRWMMVGWQFS